MGVFTSFTLSQAGMVRHWNRLISVERDTAKQHAYRRSQLINAVGAAVTGLVLIIVVRYKFTGGAYIAMLAMAVLFMLMGINRYYQRVSDELVVDEGASLLRPSRIHAVVLVSRIHLPTIRDLAYAQATHPSDLTALTVSVDPDEATALQEEWWRRDIDVPLTTIDSPYREMTQPVLEYVRKLRRDNPRDVVTVFIPEYVVGRWWEQLLHNHSALRLKSRRLFQPGVMVTSVPYQLRSTEGKEGWGLTPDPRGEAASSGADTDPGVRPLP